MLNEIPLLNESHNFNIILNKKMYKFKVTWRDKCYVIDLQDENNNLLISGMPIVKNDDLLVQLKYLEIGSFTLLNENGDLDPTYINLGVTNHLIYGV